LFGVGLTKETDGGVVSADRTAIDSKTSAMAAEETTRPALMVIIGCGY
jgi:hypothetical protein